MTERVLISMPERFLFDIDKVAEEEHRSRSELIREALRTYMERRNALERISSNTAQRNAEILGELLD